MAQKNLYEILGVSKTASADEIKSAYRSLAKKYHPDVFATADEKTKKDAEAKFKEITHAYEVLSDPQKKSNYDQFGSEDGPTMSGGNPFEGGNPFGGGNFDDFFSNIFSGFTGGNARSEKQRAQQTVGDDVECVINLSFKEACFGVKDKEIIFPRNEKCGSCGGTGSKNPNGVKVCSRCNGSGTVLTQQRTMFGVIQTQSVCEQCRGTGKIITDRCTECYGKGIVRKQHRIKIQIPAGVDNGNQITVKGEGSAAPGVGGEKGNLFIYIKVMPHPIFIREGFNISYELPITIIQAALGAKLTVPSLDGTTEIEIPEGSQNGSVIRVKGKGIKFLRKEGYGDMYIHIVIDVPKSLNLKQKNALKEAEAALTKVKYEQIDKFNKKLRDI